MSFVMPNFLPAVPEMFVLGMASVILLLDPFLSERARNVTYLLAQATLVVALLLTLALTGEGTVVTFSGTFVTDPLANLLKVSVYIATFAVFLYGKAYLQARNIYKGEFFVLALFAVLGMMVLISAHSLLTLYLGLELMSLALYAMVGFQRDNGVASEAAMKYFVLGAMASAMLLYGMSMVYGVTGSLDLSEIRTAISASSEYGVVLSFGLLFLLIGVAFKLGAVPFHMWIPDVYHGAPTAVVVFVSSAPKLAAFAMLMRLLVDGLGGLAEEWSSVLALLAVLSMALGNVVAIAQTNLKRLLAYSGISHIGFLLMGVVAANGSGYSSALFYSLTYLLMTLGGFGLILIMSRSGFEADQINDYRGLHSRNPWLALMVLMLFFSMAGVPPFLGFWAKLAVIQAVVQVDMVWLAIVAVVFSVIGAFYYLRVVKVAYFDAPEVDTPIAPPADQHWLLSANGLAVLALGLFPSWLMALCAAAIPG